MSELPNLEELNRVALKHLKNVEVTKSGPQFQVTVRLSGQPMPVGEEGGALLRLEEAMRKELKKPIEVYFEPRPDESKLRQRREKMVDWIERRGMLKTQSQNSESDT